MATSVKNFKPTDEFNRISGEWMQTAEELAQLKTKELELRNQLIKMVYPRGVPAGTNNVTLGEGWVAKFKGTMNAKVDESLVSETRSLLEKMVKEGKVSAFALDEVIRYKPGFSKTGYDALTAEQQHVVMNCVTFTAGQPGLEITKPKRAVK